MPSLGGRVPQGLGWRFHALLGHRFNALFGRTGPAGGVASDMAAIKVNGSFNALFGRTGPAGQMIDLNTNTKLWVSMPSLGGRVPQVGGEPMRIDFNSAFQCPLWADGSRRLHRWMVAG